MTERLYYTEPYRTEFDTFVREVRRDDRQRPVVVLESTAFYPTSGGQPFDLGRLADRAVIDVVDLDDGEIGHVVDGDVRLGARVHGAIDWSRRFDHMQQHTGQHLLSAAFEHVHKARTVSFHLGSVSSSIDIDRELSTEAVAAAEAEANRVVWEDRAVTIRFATAEEAASLPLHKEPSRDGLLRLIEVADYDLSACGGTHVARTGAIGIVNVLSTERFRGGLRVEFVCGARSLRSFGALRDTVAGSIRVLSVMPDELPAAIERSQSENKDLRRTIKGLQERLAGYEADALAARAQVVEDVRVVVEALEGWDAVGLKSLAMAVATRPGHVAALFSMSSPALAAIARGPNVSVDASGVLKSLTARFGGKGGGKPDLAQGGGLTGSSSDIVSTARELITAAVRDIHLQL